MTGLHSSGSGQGQALGSFEHGKDPFFSIKCKKFLVNKTNRCTKFQIYRYYDSTCFGQPFRPSSVLSHTLALVHFTQFWWLFATRSRMAQSAILFHVRLRTPEDGQKGCPKHVES